MDLIGFLNDLVGNKPIALAGCHYSKINYPCCEIDLIVLNGNRKRIEPFKDKLLEIHYLDAHNKINLLNLLDCRILVDQELKFMTLLNNLPLAKSIKLEASKRKLIRCLTNLGKVELNLNKDKIYEASFLLLKAFYQYAEASLLERAIKPSPCHLLGQLKGNLREEYEIITDGLSLDQASKVSIERRFKLIQSFLNRKELEILKRKMDYLLGAHLIVNAYCYLGMIIANYSPRGNENYLTQLDLNVDYVSLNNKKKELAFRARNFLARIG